MTSIEKFSKKFKKVLLKNYPNKKIPNELMKIIKFDINNEISREKEKPHKTIKLEHFTGFTCDIDKNISRLIKYIWMCNIDTYNSCENNVPYDYIWIQFASAMDLEKFLNIIFKDIKINDDHYIKGNNAFPYNKKNSWVYNINIEEDNYESSKIDGLSIAMSLRFPNTDYDWVCQQMKKYLVNENKLFKNEYIFVGQFHQESKEILVRYTIDSDETCTDCNCNFSPKNEFLCDPVKKGNWNIWTRNDSKNELKELIIAYCEDDITKNVMATEYDNNNFYWNYTDTINCNNFCIIDNKYNSDVVNKLKIDNNIKIIDYGVKIKSDCDNYSLCLAKDDNKIIGIKLVTLLH